MNQYTALLRTSKKCPKCGFEKSLDYFALDKTRRDGHDSYCKACRSEYVRRNREHMTSNSRKWREANPERKKENFRRWSRENAEQIRVNRLSWRAKNKEGIAEYLRVYREGNRDVIRAKDNRRRARLLSATGNHTAADVQRQYDLQKGQCYYCNCDVGNDYHIDHFVPLSRGGSNDPKNIVIACPSCNQSKGNKLYEEWKQSR